MYQSSRWHARTPSLIARIRELLPVRVPPAAERGASAGDPTARLLLAALNGVAVVILVAHELRLPDEAGLLAVALLAGLFAIAETAVIRLEIRHVPFSLALRSTPLLVGLAFLAPTELVAAQVIGMSAGLVAGRRAGAGTSVTLVLVGLLATACATLGFAVLGDLMQTQVLVWWLLAGTAAGLLACACSIADSIRLRRSGADLRVAAAYAGAAGVIDASLGMTVVIFLETDPAELWLLAGPVIVAIAGYRAWLRLRRRQERIELLYGCAQVLDGPATGSAMMTELLERVRTALRAEAAEILLEGVAEDPLRAALGPNAAADPLSGVPREVLAQRRALLAGHGQALILQRDVVTDGRRPLVDGIIVRFDRPQGASGILTVAGRPTGGGFSPDDRSLLEALGGLVGAALATDRMVAELRASRDDLQRLAALVAGTDDAIVGVSIDGTVTSWNPAAAALFGVPAEAVLGRPARMLVQEGAGTEVSRAFGRARAGEQTREVPVDTRRPDGSVIPVVATVSPVRADGEVVGVSVIARDGTARTLQDTALRERLDRFESVFEGSPIAMGVVGGDFEWLRVNDALCRLLGAPGDELVGRRFERCLVREDIGAAHGLVSRVLRGEASAARADVRVGAGLPDDPIVAALTVRVLSTPGRPPQVLCTLEDVTDRRAGEARAREAKARVQQALLDLTRIREPEAVLRAAVAAARAATDADVAAVRIPDPSAWGRWHTAGEDGGTGLLDVLLDQERLLVLSAASGTTRLPVPAQPGVRPFLSAGLHSFLGTPFPLDGGSVGVLVLANKRCGSGFDDDDVAIAEAVATQLGVSLENARAHDRALALVRELDQANGALRAASEAKSQFLANVSHELRSPLHAILLAAQQLSEPDLAVRDARRARALPATIEGSGRHLLGLIDDLVDLSRIELAAMRIDQLDMELGPLLGAVASQLSALAEEQHVALTIPAGTRAHVLADPLRLRQVLVNLVSNAVKYTPPGGEVRVTVRASRSQVAIAVRDTGVGIAPEDLERVFLPFERLGGGAVPGAGLGLPIARRIVELHGGTLSVDSEPGAGSTFTVRLPRPSTNGLPARAPAGLDTDSTFLAVSPGAFRETAPLRSTT